MNCLEELRVRRFVAVELERFRWRTNEESLRLYSSKRFSLGVNDSIIDIIVEIDWQLCGFHIVPDCAGCWSSQTTAQDSGSVKFDVDVFMEEMIRRLLFRYSGVRAISAYDGGRVLSCLDLRQLEIRTVPFISVSEWSEVADNGAFI